jgi:hypothetical protein
MTEEEENRPERIYVSSRDDLFLIESEAIRIGPDVLVYLWGGERPHIGSVAAAQPRPSLEDPARISATASVITFPGHKEDVLVKEAAEQIAAELDTHVVVTAGIHWDDLTADDIATIVANCREVVCAVLLRLKAGGS